MPRADKDKDKDKDKDGEKPKPRRRPAARPPVPAVETRGHAQHNGHENWPDHGAETSSGDPWDAGEGAPGEGVNRTLGQWLEAVVPPEAQVHFLLAAQEFVAGVQTTIEYHLNTDHGGDEGGAGALRIEIE